MPFRGMLEKVLFYICKEGVKELHSTHCCAIIIIRERKGEEAMNARVGYIRQQDVDNTVHMYDEPQQDAYEVMEVCEEVSVIDERIEANDSMEYIPVHS
jgi:hypothetical protein